jgi:hypothetical protein
VPDRSFCPTYGRGNAKHQMMPGRPYSVVVALECSRSSRSALLDAVRLTPSADMAATTAQVREVVERLIAAGQRAEDDPEILIVHDGGYDGPCPRAPALVLKQTLGWTRPRLRELRSRRPLDLADQRHPRQTSPRPPPRHRPSATAGEARPAAQAHPGPRSATVPLALSPGRDHPPPVVPLPGLPVPP